MHVGEEINLSTSCWQVHSMICTALVMRVMCCWDYTALHISTTTHGQVYTRPWIWEFENLRITLHSKLLQLREPLSYVTVNIRIGPLFVFPVTVYRATPRTQLPSDYGMSDWCSKCKRGQINNLPTPHAIILLDIQLTSFELHWIDLCWLHLNWLDFIWTDLVCTTTTEKAGWWLEKGVLKSDLQQLDLSWYTHNCTRHKTCTNTSRDKALVFNGIALFFWEEMRLLSDKNFTWRNVVLYIKM